MKDHLADTRHAAAALLRGEAVAGPHLVVTAGPEAGRRIPLSGDQTLGRGRAADVRLADPATSRLHARLSFDGRRYLAQDLGSKNGIRVNGRRSRRPRPLHAGDELTIGATRLLLAPGLLEESVATPAVAPEPRQAEGPPGEAGPPRPTTLPALLAIAGALAAAAALLLAVP